MAKISFPAGDDLKASWKSFRDRTNRNKQKDEKASVQEDVDSLSDGQNIAMASAPKEKENGKKINTQPAPAPQANDTVSSVTQSDSKTEDFLRKLEPFRSLTITHASIYGEYEQGFTSNKKASDFVQETVLGAAGLTGPSSDVGVRFQGQFGTYGARPITATSSLDLGFRQTPLNREFHTEYDIDVVLPPNMFFSGRAKYDGWNVFGINPLKNESSVPGKDKLLVSRANPEKRDWVDLEGRLSSLYTFKGVQLYPTIGGEAQGGYENWYVSGTMPHWRSERDLLLGLGVKFGGWDIYAESGILGSESEDMRIFAAGNSNDVPNLSQSIQNSSSRPMQVYRFSGHSPKFGPVDFDFSGDFKQYENLASHWGAEVDANIYDDWRVGLRYDKNPVYYIGENDRLTLTGSYTFDPFAKINNSLLAMPVTIGAKAIECNISGKQYYGGTVFMAIDADIIGRHKTSSGPTYVRQVPSGVKPVAVTKLSQEGAKPGDPATDGVVELQQSIIAAQPKNGSVRLWGKDRHTIYAGYRQLAEKALELGKAIGRHNSGFYGWQTAYETRKMQVARVFDALSNGDKNSPYYVRNNDYTIDQTKYDNAIGEYKSKHMHGSRSNKLFGGKIWNAMNHGLKQGNINGATKNPNSLGGDQKPSDIKLIGRTANTQPFEITDTVPSKKEDVMKPQNSRVVVEDSLRVKVSNDQGIHVTVSTVMNDNDPMRGIIDDAYTIVGGIKGFSVSLDPNTNTLLPKGEIDWKAGVIDKELAKKTFKGILPKGRSLDFETELVSEIEGGVVGYATLAVLKVASGSGQVDINAVRNKAIEAENKAHPGGPVTFTDYPTKEVTPASEAIVAPSVDTEDDQLPAEGAKGDVNAPVAETEEKQAPAEAEKNNVPAPSVNAGKNPDKNETVAENPQESTSAPEAPAAPIIKAPLNTSEIAAWRKETKGLSSVGKVSKILSSMIDSSQSGTSLIIGALFDDESTVRAAAAKALQSAIPSREAGVNALYLVAMEDADGNARVNAIGALDSVYRGKDNNQLIAILNQIIDITDNKKSGAAIMANKEAKKRIESLK